MKNKLMNIRIVGENIRIFERVLEYFKENIVKGKIRAGDRLLPERELALRFGVSRATLREALRSLEMLGMLSVIPGKGTYIIPPETRSIAELFGLALSLRPTISENILELRKLIECASSRLACHRASPDEIAMIRTSLQDMKNVGNKVNAGKMAAKADFNFHRGIIEATHNSFIIFLYSALETLLQESHSERWKSSLFHIPNASKVICEAHEKIYEAIKAAKENEAERLMRDHFEILDALTREKEREVSGNASS